MTERSQPIDKDVVERVARHIRLWWMTQKHGLMDEADAADIARAAIEALAHPTEQTDDAVVEALHERLAETQMLAFKWMEAHDKLAAGKPYSFPKPADLPERIAELEAQISNLESRQ